jgi:hypothetical protein
VWPAFFGGVADIADADVSIGWIALIRLLFPTPLCPPGRWRGP